MRVRLLLGCAAAFLAVAPTYSQSVVTAAAPQAAATDRAAVDPEAVAALKKMSEFLSKLSSFRLTSNSTLDVVTVEDQRLQLDALVKYAVKRPGIVIDFQNDLKSRRYYYDGKTFTIYAPKLGFYASTAAPSTNREFLREVYEKTGISLPLEDLFRWNDGDQSDIEKLTSAFNVGTATIDGVSTDHWAFRQSDFDWEIWIEKGEQPLPRKLVIIDRTDESHPGFTARLSWELNPTLADSEFSFTPNWEAKQIHMATFRGSTK